MIVRGRVVRTVGVTLCALGLGVSGASAAPQVAEPEGGHDRVTVHGEPLVHEFDLSVPGDAVEGRWQVATDAAHRVPFDAVLAPDGPGGEILAAALDVHYGDLAADGSVTAWHAAGTLAAPRSYAQAVAASPAVDATAPQAIAVRVSLPEPARVVGDVGQRFRVDATFRVGYLAGPDTDGDTGVTGPGPDADGAVTSPSSVQDPLAVTGTTLGLLALVAGAMVTLGALLRRRRRRTS